MMALVAERMEEGPLRAGRRGRSPFGGKRLQEILVLDRRLADAVGRTEEAIARWGSGRARRDEWIARLVALEAQVGEVLEILARRERFLAR
jgi:hypothetical protein